MAHLLMTPILSDRANGQDAGFQLAGPHRPNDRDVGLQSAGSHPLNDQDVGSQCPDPQPAVTDCFHMSLGNSQASAMFNLANDRCLNYSTAEIAANSPRYRRRSSTFIDAVHDLHDEKASPMAPAQLYSTMSGRLFHSGRIAIVLVGPPARGKT